MLNMNLNMMLVIWCLHTLGIPVYYSRFSEYIVILADDEFDNLLVCNIIRFLFICVWGRQMSYKP